MDRLHYQEMCQVLDQLDQTGALARGSIYLFGCTEASGEMLRWLRARGRGGEAVLDNNPAKIGTTFMGVPVRAPGAMTFDASSLVLIASRAYEAMAAQLRRLGFPGRVVKVVDYNTFTAYALDEDTYQEKKARVERGGQTLERLREESGGSFLVVCPYDALGDVYWTLAYLPYFLQRHQIPMVLIVTVGTSCTEVANLFGYRAAELSQREMDELVQALIFEEADDALIAHHDRPYTNDMTPLIDGLGLRFQELYACGVYGLPRDAAPVLPQAEDASADLSQILPEDSVILSPYAKSVVALPDAFWQDIVQKCQAQGLCVFTNIAPASEERALAGTSPLSIKLADVPAAVRRAGHFIGIRSGLCDLLTGIEAEKTVVFPDAYYSTTHTKVATFFALPGWRTIVV